MTRFGGHLYTWITFREEIFTDAEYEATVLLVESIRNWVRQHEIDNGEREGLSTSEREELQRLRRETRILKEEREILKKAAAFFAQESSKTR